MADTKNKFHVGRKFIAFILCLITLIVLGLVGKGEGIAPFIIGLYVAYATGNVVTKGVTKDGGTTNEC